MPQQNAKHKKYFATDSDDTLVLQAPTLMLNPTVDQVAISAQQEADPRCGKLKLRDWLLTIVQRCPRYLLLLKDLISCTDPDNPEHAQLVAVHTLVSKSKPHRL